MPPVQLVLRLLSVRMRMPMRMRMAPMGVGMPAMRVNVGVRTAMRMRQLTRMPVTDRHQARHQQRGHRQQRHKPDFAGTPHEAAFQQKRGRKEW